MPKEEYEVYECWVSADKNSFVKLDNAIEVAKWVREQVRTYGAGTHLNIVIHLNTEYTNV